MPKVSIIVPVYNVEKYLDRCISSLISQSLRDIEIILVNDGSTDNCLRICEQYREKDTRIKVINKENGGVALARNEGLKIALGKYIGFVDPDDWIEGGMYQAMYNEIEINNADIAMCNYSVDIENNTNPIYLQELDGVINKENIVDRIIKKMVGPEDFSKFENDIIYGFVWRCLYKNDFVKKNNIKFVSEREIFHEDLYFNINSFLCAKKVCICSGVYYHYVQSNNSMVKSYRQRAWDLYTNERKMLNDLFIKRGQYEVLKSRFDNNVLYSAIATITNECSRSNSKTKKEKIIQIKEVCTDKVIRQIIKDSKKHKIHINHKIRIYMIKFKMYKSIYFYENCLVAIKSRLNKEVREK